MTKDEALKLALKFVEDTECGTADLEAAIKEALAQPEQEPLEYWNAVEGWVRIDEVREHFDSVGCGTIYKTAGEGREPLYTIPPQRTWVGLTQEEIEDSYNADYKAQTRAIEAKLKEKNEQIKNT